MTTVNPKVVSLYSFKGGSGRSLCTANLAGHLARKLEASPRSPILMLDMDLDSAGLTILMDPTFRDSPWNTSKIITGDLNLDVIPIRRKFLAEGPKDVSGKVGAPAGTVLFVGGESVGRESAVPVFGRSRDHMESLISSCIERGIQLVLIDSASGRQDSALVCHSISDVIVYCFRLTDQFLYGTKEQLDYFVRQLAAMQEPVPALVLVPVAVPRITDKWQERYKGCMADVDALVHKLKGKAKVELLKEGVCEVESFKWIESVLIEGTNLAQDQQQALSAFQLLAETINKLLADVG